MSNGDIITSNGTFTYNTSDGNWYGDPNQMPWRTNIPYQPPNITPNPFQPGSPYQPGVPNIQPQPYEPTDMSELLQRVASVGATGSFSDFSDPETMKKLDTIMEQDVVYIRCNAPDASSPPPKGEIKVQIHQYPHDWDNSITIYETGGDSIDDLRHVNGIVQLLAMVITMSGRDVVLNDTNYDPNEQ